MCKSQRKKERTSQETRREKNEEKSRNDIACYNCGMKDHTSSLCRNRNVSLSIVKGSITLNYKQSKKSICEEENLERIQDEEE